MQRRGKELVRRAFVSAGRAQFFGVSLGPAVGPIAALLARGVTVPVSALVTVMASKFIIAQEGVGGYALYSVIAALPALLAFTTLGVGAGVTDGVAQLRSLGREVAYGRLLTAIRVLIASAAGVLLAAGCIGISRSWSLILGVQVDGNASIALLAAATLFAINMPMRLAQNILTGAGLNHQAVLYQLVGLLACATVILTAHSLRLALGVFLIAPFVGTFVGGLATWRRAKRIIGATIKDLVRDLCERRPGEPIRQFAGAMSVIMVANALALQSDRIVLSHTSSAVEVAKYSVALPIAVAGMSVLEAASMSLWPVFARWRVDSSKGVGGRLARVILAFGGFGLTSAMGVLLLGGRITSWMSNGEAGASFALLGALAALLFFQSVWWPLGIFLTDPVGLRRQAGWAVLGAVGNITASILMSMAWGAIGPAIGTVIGTVITIGGCLPLVRDRIKG